MIKLIALFRRKPGLSVEQFQAYWLDTHATKVCRLPGVRRYVQSHTLLSGYRDRTPACDGMAELSFDNSDRLRELAGTPEFAAVLRDRGEFIDIGSRIEIIAEDVVIKDGAIPANGVKNIELVKKKSSMSPEAFHEYWITVHGPLGGSIPQVQRYVQCHTYAEAYRTEHAPALDGVALTWFDDTNAMRDAARTAEYTDTRDDEDNFLTVPLDFVITKEHVIID
ncbi:MAG: EthD domain-containing protein [Gammaproteobacteria bacterium]|jgi:uncharacterized protein (TIGR02118 family)